MALYAMNLFLEFMAISREQGGFRKAHLCIINLTTKIHMYLFLCIIIFDFPSGEIMLLVHDPVNL